MFSAVPERKLSKQSTFPTSLLHQNSSSVHLFITLRGGAVIISLLIKTILVERRTPSRRVSQKPTAGETTAASEPFPQRTFPNSRSLSRNGDGVCRKLCSQPLQGKLKNWLHQWECTRVPCRSHCWWGEPAHRASLRQATMPSTSGAREDAS